VKTETVARAVARVATVLRQSEKQLIDAVVADCNYTLLERHRVEEWAREAITLATRTVDGAAWNGTILSDNAFFHPLAARFSPTYAGVLETSYARVPSEMKAITLMRAREDIKSAGLRLQQIFEKALCVAMASGSLVSPELTKVRVAAFLSKEIRSRFASFACVSFRKRRRQVSDG
jgi:hypothetical protein